MSKRHGRRGPGPQGSAEGQAPRSPGAPGAPRGPQGSQGQSQRHHGQGQGGAPQNKGQTWVQVRDSVRRDLEVGLQSLSFLERFGEGLDSQRRFFTDFPRIAEELRTGAMERLAGSMEHLYEPAQGGLDLSRFLRDLPLALGHLAAAEFAAHRQKLQQAAAAANRIAKGTDATGAAPSAEGTAPAELAGEGSVSAEANAGEPHAEAEAHAENPAPADAGAASEAVAESSGAATGAAASDSPATGSTGEAEAAKPEAKAEAVSPRVEFRTRLLAAAPQLNKAAQAYRRNTATVRRAAAPRRAVGPWRSDREVLEQARRAIEFANKIYDAYAEAWNDAPLTQNAGPEAAAEMDRFLAWTQLSRYSEVVRSYSPPKAQEAAPGVVKSEKSQPPPAGTQEAHVEEAVQVEAAPAEASTPAES